ncbi:nickel-responsive transcriptional regulator NikR [Thaumasiovibrio sp. DFM-14]|uniref:nickel-responsive transcriptional regulator NikR n=1 Tax=Thaumasiovibrio sp. DFM-14 TaxID=3384792 RepID=UPI0039A0193C
MKKSNQDIMRFSLSFPLELYNEMESDLTERQYSSRSEYIRDLFRERTIDKNWNKPEQDVMAVLCIVYDHHYKGITERLNVIQHQSKIHIQCTTHVHLESHNCLENIIIKGRSKDIQAFANQISALKGVQQSQLVKLQQ